MEFDNMINYCAALEMNNDRAWFHANHDKYDIARRDFSELLELMRFTIADNAPELANDILHVPVKDWTFRIPRDARVNKNMPPYDPSFRAYISGDRKSWRPIGYFVSISAKETLFGTGIYYSETQELNKIRRFLAENIEEYYSVTTGRSFSVTGEKLKKTPLGYPDSHPAAEIIKNKNWMLSVTVPRKNMRTFQGFCRYIGEAVRDMEPARKFLLEASGVRSEE